MYHYQTSNFQSCRNMLDESIEAICIFTLSETELLFRSRKLFFEKFINSQKVCVDKEV